MLFNYEAFVFSAGGCFRFTADDDEHAKSLMLQYLSSSSDENYKAEIHKWDPEIGKYSYEDDPIVVEIPQRSVDLEQEREISVTYIKYVKFKAHTTERNFEHLINKELKRFEHATPDETWIRKRPQISPVYGCSDERYGVDKIEEINIDTT